jgi:hypothetical protein
MANTYKVLFPSLTTEERTAYVPKDGEIIIDKNENNIYIGDGITKGGNEVGAVPENMATMTDLELYALSSNLKDLAYQNTIDLSTQVDGVLGVSNADDLLKNDNVGYDHIKNKMLWTVAPEDGATNNIIHEGSGTPASGLGTDGDTYIDISDGNQMYYKSNSIWYLGKSGKDGVDGAKGDKGDTGEQGIQGVAGADGADGKDGSYKSFIYRVQNSGTPSTPNGGTYNGATETFPSGWTDDPTHNDTDIEWVSVTKYTHNGTSWSHSGWSAPKKFYQKGATGATGAKGDKGDDAVTYIQSSQPSSATANEIWLDTDDDTLYRYNGSIWVKISDVTTINKIKAETGWVNVPADGATKNVGALADKNSVDFSTSEVSSKERRYITDTRWIFSPYLALVDDDFITVSNSSTNYYDKSAMSKKTFKFASFSFLINTSSGYMVEIGLFDGSIYIDNNILSPFRNYRCEIGISTSYYSSTETKVTLKDGGLSTFVIVPNNSYSYTVLSYTEKSTILTIGDQRTELKHIDGSSSSIMERSILVSAKNPASSGILIVKDFKYFDSSLAQQSIPASFNIDTGTLTVKFGGIDYYLTTLQSNLLRSDADGTLDNGTNTTLTIKADDSGLALLTLHGDSHGTGAIEVGQSSSYGGGISYNGDGTPAFVTGETGDRITFYAKNNNVRTEVFSYSYISTGDVDFNGTVTAPTFSGSLSGNATTASDSDKLDGLDSSQFLRSDADDTFSGALVSSARDKGIFGTYDSTKTDQIWSMGTAYKNSSTGANFGNLYGLAYKHTNNTTGGNMASGHQMVWCQNGTPYCAVGTNLWTSGAVIGGSLVTGGITMKESADRADLLEITSSTSGWGGIQLRNSSNEGRWSLMTNDNKFGIYDDENNKWFIYCIENGSTELRHNGNARIATADDGVNVTKNLNIKDDSAFIKFNDTLGIRRLYSDSILLEGCSGLAISSGNTQVKGDLYMADDGVGIREFEGGTYSPLIMGHGAGGNLDLGHSLHTKIDAKTTIDAPSYLKGGTNIDTLYAPYHVHSGFESNVIWTGSSSDIYLERSVIEEYDHLWFIYGTSYISSPCMYAFKNGLNDIVASDYSPFIGQHPPTLVYDYHYWVSGYYGTPTSVRFIPQRQHITNTNSYTQSVKSIVGIRKI